MTRRLALACLLAAALAASLAVPGALGKQRARSWAEPQIELVVSHGLMAPDRASFDPAAALTQGELAQLLPELQTLLAGSAGEAGAAAPPAAPTTAPADPSAAVSVAQLDRALVRALGLGDAAARFQRALRDAGLKPPARFGSEAVARLLGLRVNHPAAHDALELAPSEPITHAEVAYSLAQILSFRGDETGRIEQEAQSFVAPSLDDWQRRVLAVSVRFIGYPYVWGGTSEQPQTLFGREQPAGFDCSGFIWRVYKLQRYEGGEQLASVLDGRTTMQLAAEMPRPQRISVAGIQPGDVLFFGSKGPRSKPRQIDHAAIALGNGWLIQSSRYGVALAPLADWYEQRFAWARRPLAEAGLEPAVSESTAPGR